VNAAKRLQHVAGYSAKPLVVLEDPAAQLPGRQHCALVNSTKKSDHLKMCWTRYRKAQLAAVAALNATVEAMRAIDLYRLREIGCGTKASTSQSGNDSGSTP